MDSSYTGVLLSIFQREMNLARVDFGVQENQIDIPQWKIGSGRALKMTVQRNRFFYKDILFKKPTKFTKYREKPDPTLKGGLCYIET